MDLHQRWDEIAIERLRTHGPSKWQDLGPDELGAWVAEEDFGTAPAVTAALQGVVDNGLLGYLPRHLVDDVAQAFVGFAERRFGWEVSPDDVRVIPDVIAGLEWAITTFTAPGSAVLVPTPAYMPFLQVPQRAGREVIQVPMLDPATDPRLDLDAMDEVLTRHEVGLLVLCNPHNPTGHVMTATEHEDLDRLLAKHPSVRVFCDEIHSPLTYSGSQHLPYAAHSAQAGLRSITATSPSKSFGLPGLRSAQLVLTAPEDHLPWEGLGDRPMRLASTPGVISSVAAYTEADDWLDTLSDYLDQERDLLVDLVQEHLPGVRMARPEGTYVAWLDCSGLNLSESPAAFFRREAGVVLSDGAACGTGFEQCVRLVFATPRPVLTRMLRRMGAALQP